jgi:hypothetical protein
MSLGFGKGFLAALQTCQVFKKALNKFLMHKFCKAQALEFKACFERDREAIQSELWTPVGSFMGAGSDVYN